MDRRERTILEALATSMAAHHWALVNMNLFQLEVVFSGAVNMSDAYRLHSSVIQWQPEWSIIWPHAANLLDCGKLFTPNWRGAIRNTVSRIG
jgi:hypothetical protein